MSEANLSEQEAQALRLAVGQGPLPTPTKVSLAAGDRQARRYLPALQGLWSGLVDALRADIGREFGGPCSLSTQPLELAGPKSMAEQVSKWLMGACLRLKTGEPVAWVGVAPRLGFHLIEMAFGAPNEPAQTVPTRVALTVVEQQTLWPFVASLAAQVRRQLHLEHLGPLDIEQMGLPPVLGRVATDESGVVSQMSFPLGDQQGQMGFVVAPKGLEALAVVSHEPADKTASTQHIAAALGDAEVWVVANLGTAEISVGTIATLTIGQVLWLEHSQNDPVEVLVEDLHKFNATPMQRTGAVGVQILQRL